MTENIIQHISDMTLVQYVWAYMAYRLVLIILKPILLNWARFRRNYLSNLYDETIYVAKLECNEQNWKNIEVRKGGIVSEHKEDKVI